MPDLKVEKVAVDMKAVEEKVAKGEALTPEEEKEIMSEPNDAITNKSVVIPDEEWGEEDDQTETKTEKGTEETEEKSKTTEVLKETTKEEVKPEPAPEEKKQEDLDLVKLEAELSKKEGNEDLSSFSKREQAYFWQMRRERRARQKAEEDRDVARLNVVKEKVKPQEEPEEDVLAGRDAEDFITVKDAKKILERAAKRTAELKPTAPPPDPVRVNYLKMCDQQARDRYKEDYDEVMECSDEIIANNSFYLKELASSISRGDNPAVTAYHLIKGDPEFVRIQPLAQARIKSRNPEPVKKIEPEIKPDPEVEAKKAEAKKVEEKIEKNSQKPKTSAHIGTGESDSGELSLDEIMRMSDREFAKLPKKVRDAFLRKYGV